LFIGCSDSRIVPYLLTGAGPGELFLVRNVGAFVPPYDQSHGFHGTAAAIEFAVLSLEVKRIVVCGHSHCGAIRALYGEVPEAARTSRAGSSSGGRRRCRSPIRAPKGCGARSSGRSCCSSNG
jgi:carbonic anhydrase